MSKKKWKPAELNLMAELYPDTDTAKLAVKFRCSMASVYNKARSMGLKKTKEYIARVAAKGNQSEGSKATRFKKGHDSWNQGRRGRQPWHTSLFEKQHMPANTKYDGAITLRLYGYASTSKKKYYFIRVALGKWVPLHRHLWIQKYGTIPRAHIVTFKDGNSMNCVIDNLELISMAENARRNHNAEKAAYAFKERLELGEDLTGVISLKDKYVAGLLAKGDKQLRTEILDSFPQLIQLKRNQLLLNRQTNETRRNRNQVKNNVGPHVQTEPRQ